MAEESGLSKAAGEIAKAFLAIAFKLSERGGYSMQKEKDYFLVSHVPGKPYMSLQSLYDRKEIKCYSKEELINVVNETVQNAELYKYLTKKTQGEEFDVGIFNDMGGGKSDLLKNTLLLESEGNMVKFYLNDAFEYYDYVVLSKNNDNYDLSISGKGRTLQHFYDLSSESLCQTIKQELVFKEKEKLDKNFLFQRNEIPVNQLKNVGIRIEDLSKSDIKRLMLGEETGILSIKAKDRSSDNIHIQVVAGHIKFGRNPDGTVFAAFRRNFLQQEQIRIRMK